MVVDTQHLPLRAVVQQRLSVLQLLQVELLHLLPPSVTGCSTSRAAARFFSITAADVPVSFFVVEAASFLLLLSFNYS